MNGIVGTDAESEAKDTAQRKRDAKVDAPEDDQKDEEDAGEEDDEVYEIESIVHHKKNMFGKSTGFMVKWKGYPASENSWVSEEDCNAPDLIREYFDEKAKQKAKRVTPEKTRGKRPKEDDTDMDVDDQRETKRPKKKSTSKAQEKGQKSNGRTSLRAVDKGADESEGSVPPSEDAQSGYGTMDAYAHKEDWTDIIEQILTVDYAQDDSRSVVYFLQLKNGHKAATTGDWMARKAARLTIKFFEENLNFKE